MTLSLSVSVKFLVQTANPSDETVVVIALLVWFPVPTWGLAAFGMRLLNYPPKNSTYSLQCAAHINLLYKRENILFHFNVQLLCCDLFVNVVHSMCDYPRFLA